MKNELLSFHSPLGNFHAMHIPTCAPDDGNYKVFKKLPPSAAGSVLEKSVFIGKIHGRQGIFETLDKTSDPIFVSYTPIELRDLSSLVLTINDALSEEPAREQL